MALTLELPCQHSRVPSRTFAYHRVPEDFGFWMKVPEMMVSELGTVGYLRVPSRTFAYQREVLLMSFANVSLPLSKIFEL